MSGNSSDVSQPQQHEGNPRAIDASPTAICSGANFSTYVLRQVIGAGSAASVYRAHDTRLRREVAVKVLNKGALAGAEGLARFLHEARMAAAVRHPNVVNIFDVGVHDATPYIVMELLRGEDLDTRLHAARVLREPVLIDLAAQLVSGLAAVHDAGIVHRDLRPSNVFLARGPDGAAQPKLLDFSVSKQTRDNLRLTTNGRRRWAAMPLYTAPEVLLDGDATFLSDQYSLGVLLYECVTGVNPFRADSTRESIDLITTGQARRITDQPIRPSRRLSAIIQKAMHVYPEQRFADLQELGDALAAISERRGRWPWSASPLPVVARALASNADPKARHAARDQPERSGPELSWVIGAAVVGCSIAAPLWAWWSVHRTQAAAPVSVAAPLAPSESPLLAAPPASVPVSAPVPLPSAPNPCAAPCPAPAGVQPELAVSAEPAPAAAAPVLAQTAVAVAPVPAPLQAVPLAPPLSAPHALVPPPEHTAAASEGAEPPSPPGFPEGVNGAQGEAAPLTPPEPAASDGNIRDGGVSSAAPPTAADGGVPPGGDPLDPPLPRVAAPQRRQERGTNGALIFD
jgi:serine/threonine-protein kinase